MSTEQDDTGFIVTGPAETLFTPSDHHKGFPFLQVSEQAMRAAHLFATTVDPEARVYLAAVCQNLLAVQDHFTALLIPPPPKGEVVPLSVLKGGKE